MADGTIKIGIELDDGGIKSEAKSAAAAAGDAAGKELEQGLDQGSKEGADKASANIESFGANMKAVLAGISVAAIAASIGELVSITNEFQEDMGKLAVAAQVNSVSTDTANAAYRDMVGILGETDQSVEAVNHLFALCGDNTQALSNWTTIASGVYAQFGDSLPLEGLTEAANETAKVGQVTGPLADAINWASQAAVNQGVALSGNQAAIDAYNDAVANGATQEDAFNAALSACNTEQERSSLITSTLTGAYQEAGEAYQSTNADVIAYRQSQSDLQAALAGLGEAFMPIVTTVLDFASTLATTAQPAVQWFVDNLPTIAPILAGVATTIGLLAVYLNAATIATVAQTVATNAAAAAQGLFNAIMNANPIVLILTLIAGLIVALVALYNNSETFRAFVDQAFQQIQEVATTVIQAIVTFFTVTVPEAIGILIGFFTDFLTNIVTVFNGVVTTISTVVQNIINFFTVTVPNAVIGLIDAIGRIPGNVANFMLAALDKVTSFVNNVRSFFTERVPAAVMQLISAVGQIPGQIASFLGNAISSAASFASNFASKAVSAARDFVSGLVNGLTSLPSKMLSIGGDIVSGIWDGISGAAGWLWSKISGFCSDAVGQIKGFFGIASPSKVMRDEVGRWLAEGIVVGFEADNPMEKIEKDLTIGVSKLQIQSQVVGGIGATVNNQTINFNQPVETPDQIARTMRMQAKYGLAGSYV